jgi:hypothetical protein
VSPSSARSRRSGRPSGPAASADPARPAPASSARRTEEVREFIARKARQKGRGRGRGVFGDWYVLVFALAVAGTVLGRLVVEAGAPGGGGALAEGEAVRRLAALALPDFRWAVAALTLLVPVLWYWGLRAAGPLSVPRETLLWIFQAPVDRRPYLRRRLAALAWASALFGALGGALTVIPLGIGGGWGPGSLLPMAAGALLCLAALRLAVGRQTRAGGGAGERGVAGLRHPELDAAAGSGQLLELSVYALDLGSLSRVLFRGRVPSRGARPLPRRLGGRPALLMVAAEWRQWRRCRGVVPGLVITLLLGALLALSPLLRAPVLLVAALAAVTLVAVQCAGAGVGHSQGSPQRHAMWPLGRRGERLAQLAVPVGLMAAWQVLLLGGLGALAGRPGAVLAAVLAGIGAGAMAVQSSDAEPPDWGSDVYVPTPFGIVPVRSLYALLKCHAVAAAAALPPVLAALGALGPLAAAAWGAGIAVLALTMCLRRPAGA